ncbi:MAG: helix-turn-helix domain-containing protein [Limisphaerales bacterium]
MRKRRPNPRLVKIHRSYTVEEAARLFGIHKNTVREWIRTGLPTSDQKRPALILGCDLAAYLQARRRKHTRPCQPGEIYCVRCRAPKRPAGDMADCQPITETLGTLMGICPDCEAMIYRRASMAKLPAIQGTLNVTFAEAQRPLSESNAHTVNSDFSQG